MSAANRRPPRSTQTAPRRAHSRAALRGPAHSLDRVALLAHQLRTPLSAINALAQGLIRRADRLGTTDIQAKAEKIWRASLRLDELIDTILSYTRATAGGIVLNPSEFNPDELIRRVCREQGGQEPSRPFQVQIRGLPEIVIGDPILLEQALVIVLSNAMKYSLPERPIHIVASRKGGMIRIVVKDRGIGIPERDMPFIMQPFFRGRNAKTLPGTGLGLSLAWYILKLHGGDLEIDSQEGRGTKVAMVVPQTNATGLSYSI
ncbi:HAMP domain-containing histidine kinase [Microvirga sp. HBU67558]|uniref:sensor histidine kinase n=1 Tax=Microvirga TaxID=186650 RepID=UPI001B3769FB|nr:HAMP domain-containing sensor histidine kinase [Microvirga sp. HBU67655]MBQ0819794.1 HAMP domain-containing histidine kinase [Microvirga sp. HBU67558]